jgi:FkbM family methyltransferase
MANLRAYRRFLPFPSRRTLRRWFPPFDLRNLAHLIARARADLVVDVGANAGRYVEDLMAAGCPGPFLSIEPQSGPHAALSAKAARKASWRVTPRMALGRETGETTLNLYSDSSLSSVLRPAEKNQRSPALRLLGTERVALRRLDDVMPESAPSARRPFVKLDVQGAERDVIEGGRETLARAAGVQVELPLTPSYEGEACYGCSTGPAWSLSTRCEWSAGGALALGCKWIWC